MAEIMNEKSKPFASLDEEEDALLNEAICCSRNLEIKTDDDEDEEEEEEKQHPTKTLSTNPPIIGKLWCDRTSDSSSSNNTSDLSLSNGKIDLSAENTSTLSIKEEPEDQSADVINVKQESLCIKEEQNDDKEVFDNKHEPSSIKKEEVDHDDDVIDIKYELDKDDQFVMDYEPQKYPIRKNDSTETNGRNGKRVHEGNDDNCAKVPKNRRNSSSSSSTMSSTGRKPVEYEYDPCVLARRQKDVDYGKNTIGYDNYVQAIPKQERAVDHPRTPPMHLKCSRRAWDGMVKTWRKQLHFWDPKDDSESE